MTFHAKISERLREKACHADAVHALALEKAAKKIESFSRAPGDAKQATRMSPVLTPEVLDALGRAFIELRTDEAELGTHELYGPDFRQADHAFGALLYGAATAEFADVAVRHLDAITALLPRMTPPQAEHINYLTPAPHGIEAIARVHAAARERLDQEPGTIAEKWSDQLRLELPREHWSLTLGIPLAWPDAKKLSAHPLDATVWADVANYPGDKTRWNIRIGTLGRHRLGEANASPSERGIPLGHYHREWRRDESKNIRGSVEPAQSPSDFPRVLAELERAHPEVRFDLKRLSVSGGPGRLGTAARKKALREWLGSELERD